MRIAYFDCFSGISGDMALAAFLDAGFDMKTLSRELGKLKVGGYEIAKRRVRRGEIVGTKFDCIIDRKRHLFTRSLGEIIALIERSGLNKRTKEMSKDIFAKIGAAEAIVHGLRRKRDITLHELGDVDSIIDIVGVAIALDKLGIDEVHSSRIVMGRTLVKSEHGNWPIPSPASLELLKGVSLEISEIEAELVTPTGAGLLKSLAKSFGSPPRMETAAIGYGAGAMDLKDRPNMLRVILGDTKGRFDEDSICIIETNLDDMSPQGFEYLFERLFKAGALDVYTTAIQMKKTRPAFKLTVLTAPQDRDCVSSVIFRETTTFGIRFYDANRFKLKKEFIKARTRYGELHVKTGQGPDGILTISPEYGECVKLARSKNVPLKVIYDEAKAAANKAVKR